MLKLLWPHICTDTHFDCFWNWRHATPVPGRLNWPQSSASYPPSGSASFGVVYSCDFWTTCGCPQKLKVLRTNTCASMFQLYVQNVPTRHGCIHTMAKDKTCSTATKGNIPTLHPALQAFLRRQSLNHDSSSNLTWGKVAEKTAHYILNTTFMHCSLPHLLPSASSGRDYRSQCRHPHTLSLLRGRGDYSANQALLPEPPIVEVSTFKKGETRRQYSDVYCSVAPLVLEDGHTLLGCHAFIQPVAEQCRDFLRACNIRFHGQSDGPENSRLDILHDDFSKRNLYIDFQHALQQHGKLDLFRFNVIGYCYTIEPPNVTTSTSAPPNTHPRYLYHFHFCLRSFLVQVALLHLHNRFNFFCIYASIASLLIHLTAAWKAKLLGWMNYNMDVVHELGSLVHNLNIFNVAVTDAKQVAHQVSCTIHLGRKGDVYEGTSACIMAASRYIVFYIDIIVFVGILLHIFVSSI